MTLHVVHTSFHRDWSGRSAEELLTAWPTLTRVARAAAQAGVQVTVVQAHQQEARLHHDDVDVRFTTDPMGATRGLQSDVVHVHGLGFPVPTRQLSMRSSGAPVLVQDHGGGVPARWRAPLLRWGLGHVQGVAFTALEQAESYAHILPRRARVFQVLESSSEFTPGDQNEARRVTGIHGDPALLWVGRLNPGKDPLTMLKAVREAATHLPELQLWCCYGSAELLGPVQRMLDADAGLKQRVHLLGPAPHARVEQLCRAADLYVSASRAEGSGYALIEALACGLTPVVSDIPSFRAITGRGATGTLFPAGDAGAMASAIVRLAKEDRASLRARALAHFREQLTFAAIGRQLRATYEALLS